MSGLLERLKKHETPRFHGNGFTQLKLTEDTRLHVWSPKLPPYESHNATIHDHAFDLHSLVLHGAIEHRTYSVHDESLPATKECPKVAVYKIVNGVDLVRVVPYLSLLETGVYLIPKGGQYELRHRHLHGTTVYGPAATLMTKKAAYPVEPYVICPHGEFPVDAFEASKQPSQEAMWEGIELALTIMDTDYVDRIEKFLPVADFI